MSTSTVGTTGNKPVETEVTKSEKQESRDFSRGEFKRTERYNLMCQAFLTIGNADECADLLEALCTDKELTQMSNRFLVTKMIKENYTFREINDHTHMSSATIAKISEKMQVDNTIPKILDKLETTGKWDDRKL